MGRLDLHPWEYRQQAMRMERAEGESTVARRGEPNRGITESRAIHMRVVLQRVTTASVEVDGKIVGHIERGLLALVGVAHGDTEDEARWLANKTVELRIFQDEQGKMNRSLVDTGGSVLVISQFTLLGDCRKGRRPAFTDAAQPDLAQRLYLRYAALIADRGINVQTGIFAADMKVSLVNDGPVTMVVDRAP